MALRRQLNAVKRADYPWMLEVTKCAPQLAIMQLGVAFKNFFSGRARYPVFRKKGVHDRFSISNDQIAVKGKRFRVPNLGWVRMREALASRGVLIAYNGVSFSGASEVKEPVKALQSGASDGFGEAVRSGAWGAIREVPRLLLRAEQQQLCCRSA